MAEIPRVKRFAGKAVTRSFSLPADMDRAAARRARALFPHGTRVMSLYYRELVTLDLAGAAEGARENGKEAKAA